MARVSILIPVYNAERFLAATIDSVIRQSFHDWELIVLDDCSTDTSYDIALKYAQQNRNISVKKNESNVGMLLNWNRGIELCKSPYFVKLDADDIWHPMMLEKAVAILDNHPEVGLVFSKFINIDEEGIEIEGSGLPLPEFARNKSFSCVPIVEQGPDKMFSYGILIQGLSVMTRELFDVIGKYRYLLTPQTQASTDTELYFRIGCHYSIYCIDEVLYQYRLHKSSISSIDSINQLQEQKTFELRYSILSYYKEQKKLSEQKANYYLAQVRFKYNLFLIYNYRKNKQYLKMLQVLLSNLANNPGALILFYAGRIVNRKPLDSPA